MRKLRLGLAVSALTIGALVALSAQAAPHMTLPLQNGRSAAPALVRVAHWDAPGSVLRGRCVIVHLAAVTTARPGGIRYAPGAGIISSSG
jgi:hypothetical protein